MERFIKKIKAMVWLWKFSPEGAKKTCEQRIEQERREFEGYCERNT